jgi:hypothetical protein
MADTNVHSKLQQAPDTVAYYEHLQRINKRLQLSEMNDSFFL